MLSESTFHLPFSSQQLISDDRGYTVWQPCVIARDVPAARTAVIICDMWDHHWSRGASGRVDVMAPRMDAFVRAAREAGARIIHAPSETMAFYAESPARKRIQEMTPVVSPADLPHEVPPLPIDDSDGGSDTGETSWFKAWTRQHAAIEIDAARDCISDSGPEIYTFLRTAGIEQVLLAGVHTNMCILNRSFAIKQMVRWGVSIALMRDLTDAMYNPARAPYVSHAEGTRLVIEYIEKFWCPTVLSSEVFRTAPA